ncbi:Hypothetical protein SCF082_LOCUS36575 [Durusdinium trenchii]|uniref:Uncharacterized protein n=1 Tax=Durusdinium trenchii TaxID=1381693 RepID=A0ABP0PHJ7_9DINO
MATHPKLTGHLFSGQSCQGFGHCSEEEASAESCTASETELLSQVIQEIFRSTRLTLELLLGTRWPVLAALDSIRLPAYYDDPELSCTEIQEPALDWLQLRQALQAPDWFHEAKHLVYRRSFQANWLAGMEECTYGFALVSLWKLAVCAETQAECVNQYAVIIDNMFRERDWQEIACNSWGMFGFLDRIRAPLKRHEFRLDFLPSELQGAFPLLERPLWGASEPGAKMSPSFLGVLKSVLAGIPKPYATNGAEARGLEARNFLYITMVFGPRYVPYIQRFVHRAEAFGISNLVLFCLDDAALDTCLSLGRGDRCVPGTPSILNKFTLPLIYLWLNIDVFWLDFDIFLLQDPTPFILGEAQWRSVDLLVSGSFADDCICSGLVFFKATKVVAEWLLLLLSWMYEHVYTHDQQAFSAFLAGRPDEDNSTSPESISSSKLFKLYLEPVVPRWALLDPVNEFVSARVLNTTGWTGTMEKLVIFHFLHGDSEVNRDHTAYGWNAHSGFDGGTSLPLLDVFYNQSDDQVYREPLRPKQFNKVLQQALLASRRTERPKDMLHCGVLQLNPYSPGRQSADG